MNSTLLYLNKAMINGHEMIRLLFKQNDQIISLINRNDWIFFDYELKSWVTKYSDQNINILKELFEGIATVNTYYLHVNPEIKANDIVLNKTILFNHVLEQNEFKGSLLLVPVQSNSRDVILIRYQYNPDLDERLKHYNYCYWDNKLEGFCFEASTSKLKWFIQKFSNSYKIHIHQQLTIIDTEIRKQLLEQRYKKTANFKSVPSEFLQILLQRNYSWQTVVSYHSNLLKFLNAFKNRSMNQINDFDVGIINNYHHGMIQMNVYAAQTINQSVCAIKFYYKNVLRREMNFDQIDRSRRPESRPLIYSENEIEKIICACSNLKHKALITLTYSAGLRLSEVLNLKISDILSDRKMVFVKGGKGKKDRLSILSEQVLLILRDYYKEYTPKNYLFEGQYGGKYSTTSFRNILKRAVADAGVERRGSVHTLRHSFATHLLEHGV
ncbi:MAG: tyrosine-type recombinase/integrase, partial [Bacteroidetes bacterium]|nr:tyrosine-type recombinase/integrase [Bacteroidota bacterium]